MTTKELMSCKKVGPAEAAEYLQNGTTAQQIRAWAQSGACPFCQAIEMRPGSKRTAYRVHIGNLIGYRSGREVQPMPDVPYGTVIRKGTKKTG